MSATGYYDREWFSFGMWIATLVPGGDETLCMTRNVEQAAEVVREHNALVAEVRSLRGVVQAVREWAHANHGGIKTPAEVWPGLAALLAEPALGSAADAPQPADPPTCEHPGETGPHRYFVDADPFDCPGPSPAVLPEGRQS